VVNTHLVAKGSGPQDCIWEVHAGGTTHDYSTWLIVRCNARTVAEGGMSTDLAHRRDPISVYDAVSKHGPRRFAVRVSPAISTVRATLTNGQTLPVPLHDDPDGPESVGRIGVLLLPRHSTVQTVELLTAGRTVVTWHTDEPPIQRRSRRVRRGLPSSARLQQQGLGKVAKYGV
jgi:hypothetical protein